MKKNIKLIGNIASVIILCVTLLISVSYAWYTNNKNVNSTGIGSVASESISILSQGMYKKIIGNDPFPETDKNNEVEGVLSGDVIYYSVAIGLTKDKDFNTTYSLNISVVNINGGDYFVEPAIKVVEEPDGTLTGRQYTFNQELYDIYEYNDDEYFILIDGEDKYIYYLYESINGQILTRRPQLIFEDPNGSETGNTINYEGNTYLTKLDSNGREYFLTLDTTTIDGEEHVNAKYVNYIYEEIVDGNPVRYNMCDVYTIGIFKVFGVNENNEYIVLEDYSENLDMLEMTKETGLDKEVHFFNLYDYEGWEPSVYKEIIFTFAIKFDYSEFEGKINTNCVSDKELIFTNVIIKETESEDVE